MRLSGHDIGKEVDRLRGSLKDLDRSLRRRAPFLSGATSTNEASKNNGRPRPRLTAKARASLVLRGRYMGYMRQLKPRQKAQVRRIRANKGVHPAIQRARNLVERKNAARAD